MLILQIMFHCIVLAPSEFVEIRCDVTRRPAINPTGIPKPSRLPVTYGDRSAGPEERFIQVIARHICPYPRTFRLHKLKPEPSLCSLSLRVPLYVISINPVIVRFSLLLK
jgi:hypothetical protein